MLAPYDGSRREFGEGIAHAFVDKNVFLCLVVGVEIPCMQGLQFSHQPNDGNIMIIKGIESRTMEKLACHRASLGLRQMKIHQP